MTQTKQCGTFMTKCHPIVFILHQVLQFFEMLPIAFATSVLRGLRRTLEEVAGTVDNAEAGPTVEEQCSVQKHAHESGQTSYDEATRLLLHPKWLLNEGLMLTRKQHVYHDVLVSFLNKSECHRISMVLHEQGRRCESIHPSATCCARNRESERVDTGGREQHVCCHALTREFQVHAQSMHDWQPACTR